MAFLSRAVFDDRRGLMLDLMDAHRPDALASMAADAFRFAANVHADVPTRERPIPADEVHPAEPGIHAYGPGGFSRDDTVVVGGRPETLTQAPKDLRSRIVA